MKKSYQLFSYVLCFLCLTSCSAENLYQWTDKDGKIHYSNSKDKNNAQLAELPPIEKQNIDSRIEELKSVTEKTCINRGGIDCQAGADIDGSVICMDGFKDSDEKFKSLCSEVRLSYKIIMPESPHNNKMLRLLPIKVSVRNETAIPAKGVRVEISLLESLSSDKRIKLILEGPSEISAFGLSEYTFTGRNYDERLLKRSNINISCETCWNP